MKRSLSILITFAVICLMFPVTTSAATKAPAAPTSLKTTIQDEYVKIAWKKVKGATHYEVYRSAKKTGGFKKVGETRSNSFIDENVKPNTTYYYKLKAAKYGKKSGFSKVSKAIKAPSNPVITVMGQRYIQTMMDGVNDSRAMVDSPPAKLYDELNEKAAAHALKMAERGNGMSFHSDYFYSETVGTALSKSLDEAFNEGAATYAHTPDFMDVDRMCFGIGAAWRNGVMYFCIISTTPEQYQPK